MQIYGGSAACACAECLCGAWSPAEEESRCVRRWRSHERLVKNNRMAYTVLCLFVQARVLSDTVGGQGGNSRNHRARRQGSDNAQMLKTFAGPECGIRSACIYLYIGTYRYIHRKMYTYTYMPIRQQKPMYIYVHP